LTDPIGLGLENFDSIGRFRELDNGAVIDPSGELGNDPFETARELGALIRDHPDFAPCLVRTLSRYATGRLETEGEEAILDNLSGRFAASGHLVRPLMIDIVMSPMFRSAGQPQ
jgi:hypothetical protein